MNISMGPAYVANPYIAPAQAPTSVGTASHSSGAIAGPKREGAPPNGQPPNGAPQNGAPHNGPPPSKSAETGSDAQSLFDALIADDTEDDANTLAANNANALYNEMQALILSNAV